MSWEAALDVIDAHLLAAGATLTPKVTTVRDSEPDALSTVPVFAYWYAGDRESSTGGNTLTRTNLEEGVRIQVYVPSSIRLPTVAGTLERYLRAATRAVKAQLWGDASLDGNVIGIDLDGTETGWFEVSGILARTAGFTAWLDLAEVDVIAP